MKRTLIIAGTLVPVVLLLLLSCASIMHGTRQEIGISSTPTGAKIAVDDIDKGLAPAVLKLKRKKNHVVRLELEGYMPFEATLTRKVSGWVWGNLIFGGLPGLIVDAISGGLYKLTPEQVSGVLQKENLTLTESGDAFVIAVVLEPDPAWEKVGQLTRLHEPVVH